jgi:Bacterial archaeo-eukaryotic release factor family 10
VLHVNEIQTIAASPVPILTVYLNTQNRNASRHPRVPNHLAWLRKESASLARTLLPRDAERFQQAVARVEQFLEGRHPEEKALAIFYGQETWTVIPMQTSIDNEIRWGKPAIGQLFRLLSEHNSYGVAVVDHQAARFFLFLLGELTQLGEKSFAIDESQWKRKDVGRVASERTRKAHGSDQDLVERRIEAQYERLFRETADQAVVLCKEHDLAAVFLVGPERLVGPIERKFPTAFRAQLISVIEDYGKFSPRGIRRRLEPLMADYEQKWQIAAVEQLLAADRGSVTDVDEALARLQDGTIRNLVVTADHDFQLRECAKCGTVNRFGDPVCASCGGERRNVALLDILPGLAAKLGTKVEFVSGEAAQILARAGGIAGWLRQTKRIAAG